MAFDWLPAITREDIYALMDGLTPAAAPPPVPMSVAPDPLADPDASSGELATPLGGVGALDPGSGMIDLSGGLGRALRLGMLAGVPGANLARMGLKAYNNVETNALRADLNRALGIDTGSLSFGNWLGSMLGVNDYGMGGGASKLGDYTLNNGRTYAVSTGGGILNRGLFNTGAPQTSLTPMEAIRRQRAPALYGPGGTLTTVQPPSGPGGIAQWRQDTYRDDRDDHGLSNEAGDGGIGDTGRGGADRGSLGSDRDTSYGGPR